METKRILKQYFSQRLTYNLEITDDDNLLEQGFLDSMEILQLVTFIEKEFSIEIEDEEIIPENFQSINTLTNFVENKTKGIVEGNASISKPEAAFDVTPEQILPLTSGKPYIAETDNTKTSYQTYLYPDSNQMPSEYRKLGEKISKTILPLDSKGEVNIGKGLIVAVTEGMSNTKIEIDELNNTYLRNSHDINSKFILKNLAIPECDLSNWLEKVSDTVDPQVQIAILKYTNNRPMKKDGTPTIISVPFENKDSKIFPHHAQVTKKQLYQRIMQLKKQYPNLKMVYLTSRSFGGWSNILTRGDYREPIAFEEGFAVKWLIEEKIQSPDNELPWIAWGPYLWTPTWNKEMFISDGVHPSELGSKEIAKLWYQFLSNDTTSRPWFVKKC